MTSRIMRFFFLALLAIVSFAAVQSTATAQSTRYTCIFVNGCKCIAILDPCGVIVAIICPCNNQGSGVFEAQRPIPATGPLNVSLSPVSVSASVVDPQYGVITTSLDASRTAKASTITSIPADDGTEQRFPAKGEIRFFATATASSSPGITYASKTELVFSNGNLQSAAPFNNESFTLDQDVDFYNTADLSQSTAFTLQAGGSSVTLGGDDADNPDDPDGLN